MIIKFECQNHTKNYFINRIKYTEIFSYRIFVQQNFFQAKVENLGNCDDKYEIYIFFFNFKFTLSFLWSWKYHFSTFLRHEKLVTRQKNEFDSLLLNEMVGGGLHTPRLGFRELFKKIFCSQGSGRTQDPCLDFKLMANYFPIQVREGENHQPL